jgi:hypothetical protein
MTDRFYCLTVLLEKDIREDDAEPLIEAIKMVRGVIDVKGEVADSLTWMAEERARMAMKLKILDALLN